MSLKSSVPNIARLRVVPLLLGLLVSPSWAVTGGRISGTLKDPSGAVIPRAMVTLVNLDLTTTYHTTTDAQGSYSFPTVPVGRYEVTFEATGFKTQKRTGLTVDTDSALRIDGTLELGAQTATVTVSATDAAVAAQVETVQTQLGEVVSDTKMAALPLNGRSYTDLLAIQPGVAPVTTLKPNSVIMAGVVGTISPSGNLNPGDVSIDGQRESSNGFMVDGVDVRESMNGGTQIVPDLDAIDEFRVLTNNFDPEYGNYNGGMVNVITKSGSAAFHGNAFEFLRNTALDARDYFAPTRAVFRQNQFGGTIGGPIKRQKIFFFSDYQGTRTNQGIPSGVITVPSLQDRSGNLSDLSSSLTGSVSGAYLAGLLSQKLGYGVTAGEPYYTAGCTSSAQCVLPNVVIPQSAWSAPATNLLKYIPTPNAGANLFSTSSFPETARDDKTSGRVDANTARWGQFSAYYFFDNYRLDNPYPGQQGGASIPGFDALTIGRAQLLTIGNTRVLGTTSVNEFHLGLIRNANSVGEPHGGLGVSLASQGFATGVGGSPGIFVQAPQLEGVENVSFPNFVMGVTITGVNQKNNTLYLSDTFSKVIGTHTFKLGAQFHTDQINERPNATFNGTFNIDGTETGSPFADFLLGVPSNFTQSSGQPFYLRNRYTGLFVQDSWRARSNLTFNFGLRWDYIMPYWEKYNQLQTWVPGEQSVVYPGAPLGFVFPGDPGIPSTISPSQPHNFAPRIGLAYAPNVDHGFLKTVFGGPGKSSIRASFGIFYTAFQGLSAGIMYAVPPYGYNYLSPQPPLFATPFINAADGSNNGQRFPFPFPPEKVLPSAKTPDTSVNWTNFLPVAADPFFYDRNSVPYTENYMFSIQRQITSSLLFTMSYVGNQGHHIIEEVSVNPGNAALCLSLSQPSEVAPGSSTCGPFGEDGIYTSSSGQVFYGTRDGQSATVSSAASAAGKPIYAENTASKSIGNSSFNALETNLRFSGKRSNFLLGYTYSRSMDEGSNIGEQLNPFNYALSKSLSSWDLRHNFVASYRYEIPFDRLFRHTDRLTDGWSLSGTTRFSTGFPVTLYDDSDHSLLGTLGNGVNNDLLDTPNFTPGPLKFNTNPANGPAFNTALFSRESLGQLGNARRRFFYGPGINNFDMALAKDLRITESKSIEFRLEGFNVFNHSQFYGPATVDGEINDSDFGQIVGSAPPRLVQLAAKLRF
jgi:hypothetical protein